MEDFIRFEKVSKIYKSGEVQVKALDEMDFSIRKGSITVIVGQSGAGKTTLLNILGGMDMLSSGTVTVDGIDISGYSKKKLTEFRRNDVGFIFQFYNLIPNLTALENVEIATQLTNDPFRPEDVLNEVGLGERMQNFPAQLSGGEQQRVSIARALAKNPKLLLCDEPTGALDYQTGKQILKLLEDTSRKNNMTVIIVTHNHALTKMADQVIQVKNGRNAGSMINQNPVPVSELEW
jgi:putative ABC transport system ATP-binding protein